ncbi:MAG: hypothetical protein R6V59_05405 [Dehalococcoidia bacterium]
MRILTTDYIASCQLKWAAQENIPLEGHYTTRALDNIFGHELHPETKKEYKRGEG